MKKKSCWYAKVYPKNPSTGEVISNLYAICATEEDFVKLMDDLLKRENKGLGELNRIIHVEFSPWS